MKVLALALVFFTQIFSHALAQYKYVIYTDQNPSTKANEVKNLMKGMPPFSEMNMQIEIRQMSTQDLGCAPTPGIDRLVVCNNDTINQRAASEGFDQPLVVSSSSNYGGSGGSVPVITTADNVPASMMVHEYMHTLGFCDEYVYSAQDLATYDYCATQFVSNKPNLVQITPDADGYANDQEARSQHGGQIPWFSHILPSTAIASSTLGTPSLGSQIIGLFPSEMCKNSPNNVHLWKPGSAATIMDLPSAPLGPLEPILRDALMSVGLRPKGSSVNPPPGEPTLVLSDGPCPASEPSGLTQLARENISDLGSVIKKINKKRQQDSTNPKK